MGRGRKWALGLLVFLGAAAAATVFRGPGRAGGERRPYKFGATYMTMNNPFYEIIDNEIRSMAESRGDMLITRDPALNVEKQIDQVREMVDRKVDGIFINPVDWKLISPALEEAFRAGIPIIVVDTDVFESKLAACTVVSDNYEAGVQCARHLLKNRTEGNILVLTHSGAKSGVDRISGFKDTMKGHDGFTILEEEDCLGQQNGTEP